MSRGDSELENCLRAAVQIMTAGSGRPENPFHRAVYGALRWEQMSCIISMRPYWRYRYRDLEVAGGQVACPDHVKLDGRVLDAADPWWYEHFPPTGRDCRCFVQSLSVRDLQQ